MKVPEKAPSPASARGACRVRTRRSAAMGRGEARDEPGAERLGVGMFGAPLRELADDSIVTEVFHVRFYIYIFRGLKVAGFPSHIFSLRIGVLVVGLCDVA